MQNEEAVKLINNEGKERAFRKYALVAGAALVGALVGIAATAGFQQGHTLFDRALTFKGSEDPVGANCKAAGEDCMAGVDCCYNTNMTDLYLCGDNGKCCLGKWIPHQCNISVVESSDKAFYRAPQSRAVSVDRLFFQ